MMTVQDYKKRVSSRFIATDATLMAQTIVEADYYYASIKYDGHLGLLNISKGKVSLTGVDGKERNIPVILNAAENFKDDMLLAGEICVFKDGKSLSHREVSSAIAKPEKYDIRFAVFDMEARPIVLF
jgi:ATP-dependent DNA ligase